MSKKYKVDWVVIEEYGILNTNQAGWTKEINFVSWNGNKPKYDIRWWNEDKTILGKGFTLTESELHKLYDIIPSIIK